MTIKTEYICDVCEKRVESIGDLWLVEAVISKMSASSSVGGLSNKWLKYGLHACRPCVLNMGFMPEVEDSPHKDTPPEECPTVESIIRTIVEQTLEEQG